MNHKILQTIEFAPFTPSYLHQVMPMRLTTHLSNDTNPGNDQIESNFISLDLDRQAYAYAFNLNDADLRGPASFNMKTPGTITQLGTTPPREWISLPARIGLATAGSAPNMIMAA